MYICFVYMFNPTGEINVLILFLTDLTYCMYSRSNLQWYNYLHMFTTPSQNITLLSSAAFSGATFFCVDLQVGKIAEKVGSLRQKRAVCLIFS